MNKLVAFYFPLLPPPLSLPHQNAESYRITLRISLTFSRPNFLIRPEQFRQRAHSVWKQSQYHGGNEFATGGENKRIFETFEQRRWVPHENISGEGIWPEN